MASSHFFIFPSLHENLSNALIEAMSYRLPVIASNVGGNSEVVEGGGGLLVPVSDADCLAQAIQQFVVDPDLVERLGMEAQANIRHHYSIQHMVDGWEKIYMKILEERNA
jgi:glycosyltransferase involved in cell wall biosynthesis